MSVQHALPLGWSPEQAAPLFDEVMEELGPLPDLIFRAIEFGTVKNHAYFDDLCDRERPRPHIREAIVRHQARRFLEAHEIAVQDDEPITMLYEPLVALVLVYRDVCVRVLKGKRGIVPGCGRSKARKRFYNQKPSLTSLDLGMKLTKWNLLFIWDFDNVFNVSKVWVVFPTQGASKPADVRYAFREELGHPATRRTVQEQVVETDNAAARLRELLQDNEEEQAEESEGNERSGA